jgi:hypothetical protein
LTLWQTFTDGLRVASVLWPGSFTVVILIILHDERSVPMKTLLWCLVGVAVICAVWSVLSAHFSEPPDLRHPD